MIVTMTARYSALHYKDAIAQELGSDRIEEVGGTRVDEVPFGEAVLSVKINIEAE